MINIPKSILFFSLSLSLINTASADNQFSGFYAGVEAGYNKFNNDGYEVNPSGPPNAYGWTVSNDPEGGAYGIVGGFNYALSNEWLVGIQADIQNVNAEDKKTGWGDSWGNSPYSGYPMQTHITSKRSLTAKLGKELLNNSILVYTSLGVANIHLTTKLYGCPDICDRQTDSINGWVAGIGAEMFLSNKLSTKVEYMYSDYGDFDVTATNYTGSGAYEHQTITERSIYLGLNYHF